MSLLKDSLYPNANGQLLKMLLLTFSCVNRNEQQIDFGEVHSHDSTTCKLIAADWRYSK